ncbi:hypothetical protein IQ781_28025 (plasmid) [Bacillus sp. N447-1]|uniref:LNS2 domain-containing protein n=1 Tax=Bacillus sp. N447-1 TaxID=2789208 RepID=UPI001F6235BE|nr:HAD family acid phosphatase [Bacillus sp. N447-1]UNT71681.1 hypothetical protein IQ781_28025 [Bacillus sp. N447-1]
MRKQFQKLFVMAMTCLILTVTIPIYTSANASTAENFDFKHEQFIAPPKTGFENLYNRTVLSKHTPHHNGYDLILSMNDAQYIDGKFQYGDFRKDLEGEWVSIYTWDLSNSNSTWEPLGRAKTDSDGRIHYIIPEENKLRPGLHLIKLYVEGDGTEANMYLRISDNTIKSVVFDIDGTLTINDWEGVHGYLDELWNGTYNPKMYTGANDVVRYYANKGYEIQYTTARPYWLTEQTQKWLQKNGFPRGNLHTYSGAGILLGKKVATYKSQYLQYMTSKGVQLDYAYGNATTDIDAYFNAGIVSNHVFIIGPNAGLKGSMPITNYPEHLNTLPR